jgi:LETM1 and EF-hand domain-containing protein 1
MRPMVMSLANLSRPGYRFTLPSQQNLFLYESLNYSMSARRLASTSAENQGNTKPNTELPVSGKSGKPSDPRTTALFSPTPSKPVPLSSSPPTKPSDNAGTSTGDNKPAVLAEDRGVTKSKDEAKPEGRLAKTWAWIKHEANHYWDGSKLLAAEVRISSKLLRKVLNGARLTRRERRQVSVAYSSVKIY